MSGPARRERIIDVVIALTLFGIGIAGHVAARTDLEVEAAPLSALFAVGSGAVASLAFARRRWPLWSIGGLLVLAVLFSRPNDRGLFSIEVGLALMLLLASAASIRGAVAPVFVVAGVLAVATFAGGLASSSIVGTAGLTSVLVVAPVVTGYAQRTRRQYVEAVEQRLADAERERDARAARAVAEERNRIARELHDVVAHHVSLIGVQAGAARTALAADADPTATRDALAAIEASSRAAVGEMHQLLNALDGSSQSMAPQPRAEDLPALFQQWSDAGYTVHARLTGEPSDLGVAESLTMYRIVEEALTNVARHSTAKQVSVEVGIDADACHVAVEDPGPAAVGDGTESGGRGLAGMAQRVAVHGGAVEAHRLGDGFRVIATIPRAVK